MGSWLTRSRAWVYIAFYDEYVGRHIHTSAGLSMAFFIPMYMYGIHVNRNFEQTSTRFMYCWEHFDKRNRMCHNMIMEHFEMHTEDLVDLVTEMHHNGPKVLLDVPDKPFSTHKRLTIHDCALLDEMSGLTDFVDNFLN